MGNNEKECLLYLPLYDEVKNLSIGIDSNSRILAGANPFIQKKILIYGSSITQGASASRPGLAYPARLSRELGFDFINLGLSGNGLMEPEVADIVSNIDADAYIMDCFANPSPLQIKDRTAYFAKTIRAKHPNAPIIFIQSVLRQNGNFDTSISNMVKKQHENTLTEFLKLKKELKNIYLIYGSNLLGMDHEGTTDGLHPNDIGFDRFIKQVKPTIINVIK